MSDNYIKVISATSDYEPVIANFDSAATAFHEYFVSADNISATTYGEIQFVDSGENFESITCPVCGSNIDMDWWSEKMSQAYETKFTQLTVETPCCHSDLSLNDLLYEWPCGFSRFALVARNPKQALSQEQISELTRILGDNLRVIQSRY